MDKHFFDSKTMGERIRSLRNNLKLSRSEFAKIIGVASANSVRMWESGAISPSLRVTVIICNCFSVSIDELVLGVCDGKPIKESSLEG